MKTIGTVLVALLAGGAALYYLNQRNKPLTEVALRQSMRVAPDFKLTVRSADCRMVSFAEFSAELRRKRGFADKFIAPTEDSATVSVAVKGARQCPSPYPMAKRMPEFDAVDLDGQRITTASLQGRMTMISSFWKNCTSCIREVEHLNELQRLYPEVRMIAMTFESPERAREFKAEHGLNWTVIPDQQRFITRAMVRAYPAQYFYDAQANLLGVRSGWPLDEGKQADARAQMDQWIKQALAAGKARASS